MTDTLTFTIPGRLQPWQRAGKAKGGHHYTQAATRNAECGIAWHAVQQVGQRCLQGPLGLALTVFVEVPASWPAKRRQEALAGVVRPTCKPDWDNLGKAVSDALNGVLWADDAQIVEASVSKHYSATPRAVVTISLVKPSQSSY